MTKRKILTGTLAVLVLLAIFAGTGCVGNGGSNSYNDPNSPYYNGHSSYDDHRTVTKTVVKDKTTTPSKNVVANKKTPIKIKTKTSTSSGTRRR